MKSTVKLITFDVTNTLIKVASNVGVEYSTLGRKFSGIELDSSKLNKDFKKIFHEQNKLYPSYGYFAGITSQVWWGDVVKKLLISQNISEITPNFYKTFGDYLYNEFKKEYLWKKFPDCDHVLKNLKSLDYKIGVISNFDDRLEIILRNLNLLQYFSFILIPSNCNGLSKPHKEIFLEAFKLGDLKAPNEYLHVGDSYELDVNPASNLNFKSILMAHKNLKETHTINENRNEKYDLIIKNKLYATDLSDLYNKIIKL